MPPGTSNLKARLAALTQAHSLPSSYNNQEPPSSPRSSNSSSFAAKRKSMFVPPWKKNHQEPQANGNISHADLEAVQEVLSKMIFQAGVDYETRPMVVLNASALPDPQAVSYDLLLSRILAYLNLYVEADYTVVFFAAGNRHSPGWNWIWKAYRSLSRKYRKNLKQLYIVHSSFFSKMLFSLAGAIISPKFFRKIEYVSTLSELAHYVPLTQIDIPPAVYQENLKYEHKITLPVPTRSSTFGVPLEDIMGYDGEKGGIPRVVKDCIQYLRESGMMDEGLFRRSPSSAMLRAAQDAYDRGNVVSLHTFGDPYLAAVLLKKYLRDLPEPLFPEEMYPIIRKCPPPNEDPNDMAAVTYIRETLLPLLPPCAYILLSHILQLLHEVSLRAAYNRMNEYNLAIVLCPNLVKGTNPARDVFICAVPGAPSVNGPAPAPPPSTASLEGKTTLGSIITLCIRRYYEIFDDVPDRTEVAQSAPQSALYTPSPYDDSPNGLPPSPYVIHDDDEELEEDDHDGPAPPSAWGAGGAAVMASGAFAKRHRSTLSGSSTSGIASASMRNVGETSSATFAPTSPGGGSGPGSPGTPPTAYSTVGRAKSMINIEKGSGLPGHKKGAISIGRTGGTKKKASASGVEAMGITAAGFFSPPKDAPPMPSSPPASGAKQGDAEDS